MAMVNGNQPVNGGYYPPNSGYPQGYPQNGPQPGGYGNDAYSQGYQSGANGASGAAGTVNGWGNAMTNGSVNVFGTMNSVIGTTANVVGGLANMVTSLFGGVGGMGGGQSQYGNYNQPQYGQQYGQQQQQQQQAGAVGPAWGQDMAQAQGQAYQQVATMSSGRNVDNLIGQYADQGKAARMEMQSSIDTTNSAVKDLQGAVAKLQAAGGPSSAQGQALLTEIGSLKDRAMNSLTALDHSSRKVYVSALAAQMTYQYGAQRFGGSISQSACTKQLSRAWSFYNGAPAEKLHWYSMSKTPIQNSVSLQMGARQQVTSVLTQLDSMLKQQATTIR
ncbi:MAG: hypothetical protein H7338_12015 [Candidatus Sericytochromatia bacterium]|nr:hypothetical protein [Candidatus Sericytochromatia bacterium]